MTARGRHGTTLGTDLGRRPGRRRRAAARTAGAGRLLGRRARVQRDDDGAAHLLARVPPHRRRGHRPPLRQRASRPPARRRHVVDLLGRRARSRRDRRGLRGASPGRPRPPTIPASPVPGATSRSRAASAPRGSSRACGSPSSASGRGRRSRRSRPSSSCSSPSFRSPSTASAAGRGRPLVALSIVMHYRPVRRLPEERLAARSTSGRCERPQTAWNLLDSAIRWYNGQPVQPGRERALAYAERWMIDRQELDGSWGGIQPPWVWSLIAFACRGHGPESPYLRRGIDGWKRFMVDDGDRLRPEACQSPVWDTCLALVALRAAGVAAEEPALQKAGAMAASGGGQGARRLGCPASRGRARRLGLRVRQRPLSRHRRRGSRRHRAERARHRPPCGRARLRLDRGDAVAGRRLGRLRRGQRRLLALRDPVLSTSAPIIDPPSVDVTGHAVELLAREPGYEHSARRGVDYLLAKQEENGSWFGRWGVNYVYGTGAALPALEAAGIPHDHPAMRRAVAWLESVQQEDGGFGEDCRSYDARRGRRGLARARRVDGIADRLGAARPRRRRRGSIRKPRRARPPGSREPARGRRLGRAATSRAPASRATSSSTTTCIARTGRSWRSAASRPPRA